MKIRVLILILVAGSDAALEAVRHGWPSKPLTFLSPRKTPMRSSVPWRIEAHRDDRHV